MKKSKYSDIIEMPHHVSEKHPRMSLHDRAAQFSPFAALTGHDVAVKETARLISSKIELDESEKSLLNDKLQQLQEGLNRATMKNGEAAKSTDVTVTAEFTYFQPDMRKKGGTYISTMGQVKKIDVFRRVIILSDTASTRKWNCDRTCYEEIDGENLVEINIDDIIEIKI